MKTFIKKQTDIISIPKNFATLEAVADSKFRYYIRYLANPTKAVAENAFLVKLHISKGPYIKKVQPIFGNAGGFDIIDGILRQRPMQKDIVRSSTADILLTYVSDMSARISNGMTGELSRAKYADTVRVRTTKTLVSKPVSELDDKNVNMPILEANLNRVGDEQAGTEQTSKSTSLNMLYIDRRDPASAVNEKTNTIRTARQAYDGTSSKNSRSQKSDRASSDGKIVSSLLNTSTSTSQAELKKSDFMTVFEEREDGFIEVREVVDIPMGSLPDGEFYVTYELVNSKGFPIQISSNLVNHNRNFQLLKMPILAPSVQPMPVNRPGRVAFEVKQMDKNATGINIYRKDVNPGRNDTDAAYSYVGKVEMSADTPTQRVEDMAASINSILYRFVPYSDESVQSSIFTSAVVSFNRTNMLKGNKLLMRQNFVSLASTITSAGISVEIKDVPNNVTAIRLERKNLSIFEKRYGIIGNDVMLMDGRSGAPVIVDDTSVKHGNIYSYRVALIYKDGDVNIGSNQITVEFSPAMSNVATAVISEPQIIQQASGLDVTFSVTFNVLNQGSEQVRKFISEQGLLSEFQSDITNDKEKLNRLFAYGVTRTNLTSGDVESFGIVDSKEFSDRGFGISKNIKPLDPGAEYRYTVKVYFRNPETLFPKLERVVSSSINSNQSYVLRPYKWRQPITLREGTIVSEASLKANHAYGQFALGDVADIQHVTVSLASLLPNLSEAQATQVREKSNLIQWKVTGNVAKVDHFVIMLETLGMKTIVGCAHNISNSNYFEFLDNLDAGEKGALTYSIVPIYYDYSRGTELKTNTVVI